MAMPIPTAIMKSAIEQYRKQFGKPIPIQLLDDLLMDGECFWNERGERVDPSRVTEPENTNAV